MDNEDEGARLTRREENRELIAKHRAEVEMLAERIVERATVDTPITDAVVKMMEAGWLSLGSSAPGAVKPLVETMERMERELIDLKQRLLPQYLGRAQRAEHERDALLEQLIATRSATEETAIGNARYEYLRTLNPRQFAALFDEALHGDRFDDLVDRYRDASRPSPTTREQP